MRATRGTLEHPARMALPTPLRLDEPFAELEQTHALAAADEHLVRLPEILCQGSAAKSMSALTRPPRPSRYLRRRLAPEPERVPPEPERVPPEPERWPPEPERWPPELERWPPEPRGRFDPEPGGRREREYQVSAVKTMTNTDGTTRMSR